MYCSGGSAPSLLYCILIVLLGVPWNTAQGYCSVSHFGVGSVTSFSCKVWLRSNSTLQVGLQFREKADVLASWLLWSMLALTVDTDYTGVFEVGQLHPSTEYSYRFVCQSGEVIPMPFEGSFRTLAKKKEGNKQLSFTFGSCLAKDWGAYEVFDDIDSLSPDFMLLMGDQIYADHPALPQYTRDLYESKYRSSFSDNSFCSFGSHIPLYMMWDDHEFKNDYDAGADTQVYKDARQAFNEYAASRNPTPRVAGEIYFNFSIGDVDLFMLDTRSHRSRNSAVDNNAKSMLGQRQKEELKDWLQSSTAAFKFIVSSVFWTTHAGEAKINNWSYLETWNLFTTERDEIFEFIWSNDIEGILLLSADAHWSGVFTHGSGEKILYEFAATPLSSSPLPKPNIEAGGDILYIYQGKMSSKNSVFGRFQIDTAASQPVARYDFHVLNGKSSSSLYHFDVKRKNWASNSPEPAQSASSPELAPSAIEDSSLPFQNITIFSLTTLLLGGLWLRKKRKAMKT